MRGSEGINNADGIFFCAGPDNKLRIIHGVTDFGNNMIRPYSIVSGHMGMNGVAFVGLVDLVDALTITPFDTPTRDELAGCITRDALRGIQPELVARTGRRFSLRHRLFNDQSSKVGCLAPSNSFSS